MNLSFDGVNNRNFVLPPDPNGDIGPNHYVQMVNLSFAIYNRAGALLYGPANNNTLFSGFGGVCETTNNGDPIVLYDHLADRWMMSQFALPNSTNGPFYQCFAISQTPDPTGAWHRYQFFFSNTKMNDYPKFGLWPDAYYMAVNQFNAGILSWAGQGVVAFERDKMLAGLAAQMVYFDLYGTDPNLGGMLPADLDGPAPPPGSPGLFAEIDDDAWGYSPDQVQMWQFSVNWTTPVLSAMTHLVNLPAAAFDSNMCNYARNCIPALGGYPVDAIADRLMYRMQYRNFGDHQALVTNHTVDTDGTNRAGVRWYELRNTGAGWSIHQQGTFAPDSLHRWMGSMAMNGQGDIALGYSVSSSAMYPAVRVTGRLAADPLGQMTQGESTIVAGGGSQTSTSSRWGDYSSMMVDPADDCTFWYTQEYYSATTSSSWRTRIGSFDLGSCGPPAPAMHVGDLDGTSTTLPSGRWRATVTITVHDESENPVANATVNGSWSAGSPQTGSCITDATGKCSMSSGSLTSVRARVLFTVTNVTHPTLTYQSSANHDPDGDSGGRKILVNRP